jgi:uncharacterized membrane protein YczE
VTRILPTPAIQRLVRCVVGLGLFGVGISLLVVAELGLAPWDVLHQGISKRTGLPIGTVIILVGIALMVLWVPLRERPGIGTLLNAVEIGLVVNLVLPWLPDLERLAVRVPVLVLGIALVGIGSGLYIGAGLGAGPRDGLMLGLERLGLSVRGARTLIEATVLVGGFLLGGAVGVGTLAFALGIGPLVQVLLPHLRVARGLADVRTAPRARLGSWRRG